MVDLPAGRQGGFLYNIAMSYYIYIIQSDKDKSLYKGLTNNLERRIKQHNSGKNPSTKNKGPYKLVYYEECENRIKARKREIYFKSGVGREQLRKLIEYSSVAQR